MIAWQVMTIYLRLSQNYTTEPKKNKIVFNSFTYAIRKSISS